jgi:hypothetical protein
MVKKKMFAVTCAGRRNRKNGAFLSSSRTIVVVVQITRPSDEGWSRDAEDRHDPHSTPPPGLMVHEFRTAAKLRTGSSCTPTRLGKRKKLFQFEKIA